MSGRPPRIALISAVPAAIPPAVAALAEDFPESQVWNILDDRLLSDADDQGGLTDDLRARMDRLIGHALREHADGVLLTCSLYGVVAQDTSADVPVLAPDQAAFAELAAAGFGRVLVVASFEGAKDDSVARLREALQAAGAATEVAGFSVPAAMEATKRGDLPALVAALTDGLAGRTDGVDAVFLAQYSLAPAGNQLAEAVGIPILSGPKSSAVALRRALQVTSQKGQ